MLKVMTLNLNYYETKHGTWEERRDLIVQAIRGAQPDILALQAVRQDPDRYDGLNQASQLSRLVPEYKSEIFQQAAAFPDGTVGGSAVLSLVRPKQTNFRRLTLLPGLADQDQRLVLHTRFDIPGGPLHLFNAHLSWEREGTIQNLDETIPFLNGFPGKALLVGDLNTPSDSDLLERLRAAGWSDLWAELHPEEAGLTFESNNPSLRIDYAWANAGLRPLAYDIQVTADQPGPGEVRASDHFGLLVTLDLSGFDADVH